MLLKVVYFCFHIKFWFKTHLPLCVRSYYLPSTPVCVHVWMVVVVINTLASLVSVISHCLAWLRSCVLMWLYAQKISVSCNHLFIRFLNELVGLLFSLFKLRVVSSLFLIKRNLNEILLLVNKKVTENIWWQEFGNRKNFPQEKKLRD